MHATWPDLDTLRNKKVRRPLAKKNTWHNDGSLSAVWDISSFEVS